MGIGRATYRRDGRGIFNKNDKTRGYVRRLSRATRVHNIIILGYPRITDSRGRLSLQSTLFFNVVRRAISVANQRSDDGNQRRNIRNQRHHIQFGYTVARKCTERNQRHFSDVVFLFHKVRKYGGHASNYRKNIQRRFKGEHGKTACKYQEKHVPPFTFRPRMFLAQKHNRLAHNPDDIRRTADPIPLQRKVGQPTYITKDPHRNNPFFIPHLENQKL